MISLCSVQVVACPQYLLKSQHLLQILANLWTRIVFRATNLERLAQTTFQALKNHRQTLTDHKIKVAFQCLLLNQLNRSPPTLDLMVGLVASEASLRFHPSTLKLEGRLTKAESAETTGDTSLHFYPTHQEREGDLDVRVEHFDKTHLFYLKYYFYNGFS